MPFYVGIDSATKTFAFCLLRVSHPGAPRLGAIRRRLAELRKAIENPAPVDPTVLAEVAALDAETRGFLEVLDGDMADLVPGKSDGRASEIHTVERVRSLLPYLARRVFPAVDGRLPAGAGFELAVEFQEGANSKSRTVATAVLAAFAMRYGERVRAYLVGPVHKNKLAFEESGRYYHFTERYANNYLANKAHAKHNFAALERVFASGVPPGLRAADRGHVADACLTVLGHLAFGDTLRPEEHF
jgi:hypothetical protein